MDGGGSRGVTTVEILKKLEHITGKRIEESFDLIAGTSAGGLSAVCVGMKKLPLEKISNLQDKLCYEVFAHGINPVANEDYGILSHWARLQSRFSGATQMLRSGSFYSSKLVEELFQSIVGEEKLIDTAMDTNVKVFLVSTVANCFPPQIYLWRNYQYPINGTKSRYMGSMTQKLWEAMRASTSAPSYFDEFVCGNEKHQDGGCIANNPTAIAIHEANCLWPKKKIDCIVSVGAGNVPKRESKGSYLERTIVEFIECATSVDRIHDLMEDSYPSDVYFRFNPIDERYSCDLDESHPEKLEAMRLAARNYVDQNEKRFQELAAILSTQQQNCK